MIRPAHILHVQDGQVFFYLANNGAPFGQRHGPYADAEAADQAAAALRRAISAHAANRLARRAADSG